MKRHHHAAVIPAGGGRGFSRTAERRCTIAEVLEEAWAAAAKEHAGLSAIGGGKLAGVAWRCWTSTLPPPFVFVAPSAAWCEAAEAVYELRELPTARERLYTAAHYASAHPFDVLLSLLSLEGL